MSVPGVYYVQISNPSPSPSGIRLEILMEQGDGEGFAASLFGVG